MKNQNKLSTLDMIYIALFGVLIGICSWITIPGAVPFTLQTFGVFLTVSVLGGKRGTSAVLLYIFMGLLGIPVFSGFQGGIGVILGPTGGCGEQTWAHREAESMGRTGRLKLPNVHCHV